MLNKDEVLKALNREANQVFARGKEHLCNLRTFSDAVDFITQQSAEIERLQAVSEALRQKVAELDQALLNALDALAVEQSEHASTVVKVAELEAKVPNIPLASEEEKQSGWTLDYKWVSAIEDAVYSEEGWQVGMEGTEAIICKALNIPRTLPTTPQEMKE
jgi:hypothetical protein